MSTFNGEIKEIRKICVDNFESKEYRYYFLSHCHSDHMNGIGNLSQISASLYTTNLSAMIIRQRFPSININILEYAYPTTIEYTDDDGNEVKFTVTALNATGHCMGACMLLFQIEGLDILYTGDFRISMNHIRNIKLFNEIKKYKNLVLYLDTTFLNETFKHFPSQHESCSKVIEIIENHLKLSPNHKVSLQTSARYGYERLLIEIKQKLNEKVYIHESNVYKLYSVISDLTSCVSTDMKNTRIFLNPSYLTASFQKSDENLLTIQLSAFYWKNWVVGRSFDCTTESKNKVRVCYATHNSKSELEDFVKFIEPKVINANVIPINDIEKKRMMSSIQKLLKVFEKNSSVIKEPTEKFRFKRLRKFLDDKTDKSTNSIKLAKKM